MRKIDISGYKKFSAARKNNNSLKHLKKVMDYAEKNNVSITIVDDKTFEQMSNLCFDRVYCEIKSDGDIAYLFSKGILIISKRRTLAKNTEDRPLWVDLIYFLGHILAVKSSKPSKDIFYSKEYDFLGWEFALVEYLGLPLGEFLEHNEDYCILYDAPDDEHYMDMSDLLKAAVYEPKLLNDFVKWRIDVSKKLGMIKGKTPKIVRKDI